MTPHPHDHVPASPIAGRALLIGLTHVDPANYPPAESGGPWDGRSGCWACGKDVLAVKMLLQREGYTVEALLDEGATCDAVTSALDRAARSTKRGDTFFFYYTGHGGGLPDQPPGHEGSDEDDGQDETLCLFDGQLRDDVLNEAWVLFPRGSAIYMFSDSCHSGSSYRNRRNRMGILGSGGLVLDLNNDPRMKASLLHIGACRDLELAVGEEDGGLFTKTAVKIWNEGRFQGDWNDYHDQISAAINRNQLPQGNLYGPDAAALASRRPFQTLSQSISTDL